MATELKKLGQTVYESEDSLKILSDKNALIEKAKAARAKGKLLEIETYEDHRFAMSFGVLGTYDLFGDGQAWLSIKDSECCGKTCLLYTSPSPRDRQKSRMPSSA